MPAQRWFPFHWNKLKLELKMYMCKRYTMIKPFRMIYEQRKLKSRMKRASVWNCTQWLLSFHSTYFHRKWEIMNFLAFSHNVVYIRFHSNSISQNISEHTLSQFFLSERRVKAVCAMCTLFMFLYPCFRLLNPHIGRTRVFSTLRMRSRATVNEIAFAYNTVWIERLFKHSSCCIWATIRVMCRHFANNQFSYKLIWCQCSLVLWQALAQCSLLSSYSAQVGVVNYDLNNFVQLNFLL